MDHRPSDLNERFIRRIGDLGKPLRPQRTAVKPRLQPLPEIRALLFDVYGTMLVSASGDIGISTPKKRDKALAEALRSVGFEPVSQVTVEGGLDLFDRTMSGAHRVLRQKGCLYPEIDICSIWNVVLSALKNRRLLAGRMNLEKVQGLALEYECRVNPVWPMPQLDRTLKSLHEAGMILGIVSNAQFYTPLVLRSYLRPSGSVSWFDPEACVFSYRIREAKPSPRLLAKALRHLRTRYKIRPNEVLCVGNDMQKDMVPALNAGCRTALFAGDRRSYRPAQPPGLVAHAPDLVITSLSQIDPRLFEKGSSEK